MIPLLFSVMLLFSCEKWPVFRASGEPVRIIELNQADAEMAQIAEDARSTLSVFFRQLLRADGKEHHYFIKYPFIADAGSGGIEQVWLTGIRFKNGTYYGNFASDPIQISGMKKGDTTAFEPDRITDWMYIQDEKIIGGSSIQYLLNQIPADQRTPREQSLLKMFE